MIDWRRSFIHGLISIVFIFITALGFATAKKVGDDINSTSWQSYSNSESNFTFEYPQGWEIADDFYYKTHWSVTLQKIGGSEDSDNWIRINSPQFQVEDGVCILVGNEAICTYSRNADVLEILKRVTDSFKLKDVQKGQNIQ